MLRKRDIRRAVHVTCVVVGGQDDEVPVRVTLRVKRRRGRWFWSTAASRQVACFAFGDRPRETRLPVSVTAVVDLEYLYKVARKADSGSATVKVCVEYLRGGRRVARVGLHDFLGQLLRSGQPEWSFLQIYEEKVTMVQANHPLPEVVPEWLFDGAGKVTQAGKESVQHDNDKSKAVEERTEKDNGEDKALEEEETAKNVDKTGSPEHTGEECARGRNVEEKVESGRKGEGEEKSLEHAGKKRGRDSEGCEEEGLEHTWEECGRDTDGSNTACYDGHEENPEHTWEECGRGTDGNGFAPVAEGEATARERIARTEKGAEAVLQGENEGKFRKKAEERMYTVGPRRWLESGMRAAGRFAVRALAVTGVVFFTMVLLDPLLPPFDEEGDYWGGGGGFVKEL